MKKILSVILAIALFSFAFATPALAGDATKGAAVFKQNCQVCHAGGKNTVNKKKTLSKEDLEKYGKNSLEAIVSQVTNGAGAMPAFGRRIKPASKIEDVAAYVLEQAEKGWK
ncbi:MAG: c-type cytochrome [Symploca sp. SIO2E6]|nr:c-type cytochrome [Symploca sp. SIO2E6]